MTTTDLGNGLFCSVDTDGSITIRNPDAGLRVTLPFASAAALRTALAVPPGSAYPAHLDTEEREIIDTVIRDALAAGYSIEVCGDGQRDLEASTDYRAITENVAASSETMFVLRNAEVRGNQFVYFVHGNGTHVLSDYTDSEACWALVARANSLAEAMEG